MKNELFKGRGASIQPKNPYSKTDTVQEYLEGIDEPAITEKPATEYLFIHAKSALSKNDSPDLRLSYSVNPYSGCEHGCIYCYARNSHQYWGFDAGLGFETKILVKSNIVEQLEKEFESKRYKPQPIMLSGNTDCYQPLERKFQLTRGILKLCLEYSHPISIVTKNALIERDADVLRQLANKRLVHVYFSINHLDRELKLKMEPRTATAEKKLELIEKFSGYGIPCGVMVAPIIPGLNLSDIHKIIRLAGEAGALAAGYTVVRLNGTIKEIFENWLKENFPDRYSKVMHQVASLHGGRANDSEWGRRIKGTGPLAITIEKLFRTSVKKYLKDREMPDFDMTVFKSRGQLGLFG
jgi:DNA repair photolyase